MRTSWLDASAAMSGTTLPPGPGRTEIEEKKRSKQGIIMPRCGSEQRNETRGQKTGIHVGHLRVRMGQTGSCGKKRPPTHGGCGEPLHEGANPVGDTERRLCGDRRAEGKDKEGTIHGCCGGAKREPGPLKPDADTRCLTPVARAAASRPWRRPLPRQRPPPWLGSSPRG